MRLAAKLVLLYLVGLLLIVGVFTVLTLRNEKRLAAAEHQRAAAELVASMRGRLRDAYRRGDENEIERVLKQTTTQQTQRMKVRLVDPKQAGRSEIPAGVPIDVLVTRRQVTTISLPDASGNDRLYTYVPINADTSDAKTIEVSSIDEDADERLRQSLWQSAIAILGVSLLSCGVILVGGIWMVGRPLDELIRKVHQIGDGDFGDPIELHQHDELGKLGLALNQMCDQLLSQRNKIDQETAARLATVGQLRHADRLSTLGRLAAGVAHEMGTPLNVVSGRAELIASGELSPDETRRSATAIKQESDRIAKIIRSLLDFARRGIPQRTNVDLRELIDQTLTLMEPIAEKANVRILWSRPETPVRAEVDAGQIQQVLTNLIVNAVASMSNGGELTLKLTKRDQNDAGDFLEDGFRRIEVIDQGHGIAPENLESIFEPFFTTKDVGEGTGLGLSIAHGIVEDHDGHISVQTERGNGTTFTVDLPTRSESVTKLETEVTSR